MISLVIPARSLSVITGHKFCFQTPGQTASMCVEMWKKKYSKLVKLLFYDKCFAHCFAMCQAKLLYYIIYFLFLKKETFFLVHIISELGKLVLQGSLILCQRYWVSGVICISAYFNIFLSMPEFYNIIFDSAIF